MRKWNNLIIRALLVSWLAILPELCCSCESISLLSNRNHYAIIHRIEAALFLFPSKHPPLRHFIVEKNETESFKKELDKSCLIVTIGSQAFETALSSETSVPILSVLIRKSVFHHLLAQHQRSLYDKKHPLSVIYLDQPMDRQIQFINLLFSNDTKLRLGVLIGSHSYIEHDTLHHITQTQKIELTSMVVKKYENPVAVLDSILNDVDCVLALPDPIIYHPNTARGILLTAFHKKVPLIAYSQTFVNNGALASVYSSSKQIGDQTAKTISTIIKYSIHRTPKEQYPDKFNVAINYNVAHSLGLTLPEQTTLKKQLDELDSKVKS